jgi:hypothetical protein
MRVAAPGAAVAAAPPPPAPPKELPAAPWAARPRSWSPAAVSTEAGFGQLDALDLGVAGDAVGAAGLVAHGGGVFEVLVGGGSWFFWR